MTTVSWIHFYLHRNGDSQPCSLLSDTRWSLPLSLALVFGFWVELEENIGFAVQRLELKLLLNCLTFFCHGITKFYFSEGFQELEPPRSCQFEPLKCRDRMLLGSASFTTPSLKVDAHKFSESDSVPQSCLIKEDIRLRRTRDS